MIVMPAFPESQQSHNPLVAAAIVGLKLALTKGVTDGIDAKGHMVSDKNPHQGTPQETRPAANHEGDQQRKRYPEQEGAIYKDNDRILHQMAAVLLWISKAVFEEPAHVRVKDAFHRAMGVAFAVGLRMMFNVRCCPLDWRCLYRHGTKDE